MKTKNDVQKTTLKTVAATTGLVILSLTVNAQDNFKSLFQKSEINNFAMVLDKTKNNSTNSVSKTISFTNTDAFVSYLAAETEEPLQLEDWMMDETSFTSTFTVETETEIPLQVEDWMTNESNFNSFSALLETETESELVLEDWMMNEKIFNNHQIETKVTKNESKPISTATFFYREVNIEELLEVESWMLNSKTWEK